MMASNDVKTNVSITLTGKEAENQIEVLKKKAKELRKKLQEVKQALYSTLSKIQNLKRFTTLLLLVFQLLRCIQSVKDT